MDYDQVTDTITPSETGSLIINATGGLVVPIGTVAQRVGSPSNGTVRYNSSTEVPEVFFNGSWNPTFSTGGNNFGFLFDDLWRDALTSNTWEVAVNGTGASVGSVNIGVNSTDRAIGVQQITPGTTAAGRACFGSSTVSTSFGYAYSYYETRVQIPILSTALQEFIVYFGWMDMQGAAGTGTDGVFFRYNRTVSTNWVMDAIQGGTLTSTATSTAVTAAQWYKLAIEVNAAGTLVTFYIDGISVGTIATNIPTGSTNQCGLGHKVEKTVGTTARVAYVDWVKLFHSWTTPR